MQVGCREVAVVILDAGVEFGIVFNKVQRIFNCYKMHIHYVYMCMYTYIYILPESRQC